MARLPPNRTYVLILADSYRESTMTWVPNRLQGRETMKRMIGLIALALLLVGCGGAVTATPTKPTKPSDTCTLAAYRDEAEPLMETFSTIVKGINIEAIGSRTQARPKLIALQGKINSVECRRRFPLKHETLEYSVIHMLEALDHADDGDNYKALQSVNRAILNVEMFNDWTVDVP